MSDEAVSLATLKQTIQKLSSILENNNAPNEVWSEFRNLEACVEKLQKQYTSNLNNKTKDNFKTILKLIAETKGMLKPEHANQVLSDIDGNNHFVNVSWYFALGYSYAYREVLGL